jgi:hypothetical protein
MSITHNNPPSENYVFLKIVRIKWFFLKDYGKLPKPTAKNPVYKRGFLVVLFE